MAKAAANLRPKLEKHKRKHRHKKPLNLNKFQELLPESRFDA